MNQRHGPLRVVPLLPSRLAPLRISYSHCRVRPLLWHDVRPNRLHRHLAGLEMRLALASEDVEANLADASDQALRRIPAAAAEVTALQVERRRRAVRS